MIYGEPGFGAITFAAQFVYGIDRDKAKLVIEKLIKGELHDRADRRIKSCDYCGYLWKDDSLRNTRKTCSDDCRRAIKTLQRRQQRADKELVDPKPKKKKKTLQDDYVYWMEYPYWIHEYSMIKIGCKLGVPHSPSKINRIFTAKQRYELIGGRRKPDRVVLYNGDEEERPRVFVRYPKSSRDPSQITVSIMSPTEIENYLSSKYSERHLRLERYRARTWRKF